MGMDDIKKKEGTLGRSFVERERASDRGFHSFIFFLVLLTSLFLVFIARGRKGSSTCP